MSWALVRAPLLAADRARDAGSAEAGGSLLPRDLRVRAALGVASPDLTSALGRTRSGDPAAGPALSKLLRYLIRMSTRPTPYGLFAGVGLVGWGAETDLALAPDPPRTRTRPDAGWLLDLVANLEADAEVCAGLRLVANSSVLIQGGRAFVRNGAAPAVSIRATGAVRQALRLARAPIGRGEMGDELRSAYGASPEKVEGLLDELCRQGFLLLDLRPPLTGGDPASAVCERLTGIPAARSTVGGLTELLGALAAWDGLGLEERVEEWPGLLDRVRTLQPGSRSGNLLQVDMALPLLGKHLSGEIGAEAARAGELLLRLAQYPRGLPQLDAYRRSFQARYGHDREVPLLELLDPDLGLGSPGPHDWNGVDGQPAARRQHLLRDLALDAHRNHRLVVELDDALIERLESWTPTAGAVPPTLDVSVFVVASSPMAIDAGDFTIVVGPNLGAGSAGRTLGRFADLLGAPALAALREVAAAEATLAPHCLHAEVVYMPARTRSANVAIRPAVRTHEIVISVQPGVAGDHVVPVNELVVGLRAGRFVVRWPPGDAEIVGVQGHMLNPMQAPPAARFLLDLAGDGRCLFSSFSWGTATSFPFLPRVQSGRIILALAQWRVGSAPEELPTAPADSFADSLGAWRERWSVPRYVYLAVGDNRLLLDLDDALHVELMREEVDKLPDGQSALLQEALPGPEDAWLPGPEGGHIVELVVPVALREPAAPAATPAPTHIPSVPASRHDRLRLPGSDWLYLKLYGPRPFEDELISGPIRSFGEFVISAGLSDGWFFVRYADPNPHLRLRFHGEPRTLLGPLMQQACAWAGELVEDGACTSLAFDTYEREVERYGGEDGIRAAEAIFIADSHASAGVLQLSEGGGLPLDMTTVVAMSTDDLLEGVGLDVEARLAMYRKAAPSPQDGKEYRRRKGQLRSLLGSREALAELPEGESLSELLNARRSALAPTAELLARLERSGHLVPGLQEVCSSFVHMHVNRLVGPNPQQERLVLQLLRRTRDGLRVAPLA